MENLASVLSFLCIVLGAIWMKIGNLPTDWLCLVAAVTALLPIGLVGINPDPVFHLILTLTCALIQIFAIKHYLKKARLHMSLVDETKIEI